jgi:hypothetical protein
MSSRFGPVTMSADDLRMHSLPVGATGRECSAAKENVRDRAPRQGDAVYTCLGECTHAVWKRFVVLALLRPARQARRSVQLPSRNACYSTLSQPVAGHMLGLPSAVSLDSAHDVPGHARGPRTGDAAALGGVAAWRDTGGADKILHEPGGDRGRAPSGAPSSGGWTDAPLSPGGSGRAGCAELRRALSCEGLGSLPAWEKLHDEWASCFQARALPSPLPPSYPRIRLGCPNWRGPRRPGASRRCWLRHVRAADGGVVRGRDHGPAKWTRRVRLVRGWDETCPFSTGGGGGGGGGSGP